MKRIKTFHRFNSQFLKKLPDSNLYFSSFLTLSVLLAASAIIWFWGPTLKWDGVAFLAQAEKRLYVIGFLLLSWLLKFLLIDLAKPRPFQEADENTRHKLMELAQRFDGAMRFLKKTTSNHHSKTIHLSQLPWYLLIGPNDAGKTALLANSGIHFLLQRRLPQSEKPHGTAFASSDHCDWWVTREASIIDVPSKYLSSQALWHFFLHLVKKERKRQGLNGIIIALPLPEILKQADAKKYHSMLVHLLEKLKVLQKNFPFTVHYQLLITKCDLLPGFNEFFAEAGTDEITQAWGISLPPQLRNEKLQIAFTQGFDALIKKLNQQLIWRLHQERNPMARPYIKDFPLQIERLKECLADLIKKINAAGLNISLRGIYLTSAAQEKAKEESTVIDEAINVSQRALQLFKEPGPNSRAYFIKQFLLHGLTPAVPQTARMPKQRTSSFNRYLAYSVAVGAVSIAAVVMGRDFERGVKQAYSLQNHIAEYRLTIQQANDPNEHLLQTLTLLNTLKQSTQKTPFKFDISYLINYYSQQSQQKSFAVYHEALQAIFVPEIKNYLGEFLKVPVNKKADAVYAALKAYLMMGDASHFDSPFIISTVQQILPQSMGGDASQDLASHLRTALQHAWRPLALDTELIVQTRKYFSGMQNPQLSYIILKNTNGNSQEVEINLGHHSPLITAFQQDKTSNRIPAMFTAKYFSSIVSQESIAATQETLLGNWILGQNTSVLRDPASAEPLLETLRSHYVNQYIEVWEKLLDSIQLVNTSSLEEINSLITHLVSHESPLLQLLQTLHDNTYFEPISSASPKLQQLGALVDKGQQSDSQLYQVFNGLQNLHRFLQSILNAENEKKAAFEAVSLRMQQHEAPDAITQIRLIADKSPEPLKSWLSKIANDTWRLLMQDALHYMDTTWQRDVVQFYKTDIANRYPFSTNSGREVNINKFVDFFGKTGVLMSYYQQYLYPFVDTTASDWRWKTIHHQKLPFSDETLRQIQHAFRIHQAFFPNQDNKLFIQFNLQPYQIGKGIKQVKLNINNKQFIDDPLAFKQTNPKAAHVIAWPSNEEQKIALIQLTLANRQVINHRYSGDWALFKLVNQSFESVLSKRQMLINLSFNEQAAKYVLFTQGQMNPFVSLNLKHFQLPLALSDNKA